MNAAALESEMGWLPLILTVLVFALAFANLAPAGGTLAAFRNGMLLLGASIASAAVWLMWALVLR